MTVKNLFIIDAIVCPLFGLPLIFTPHLVAKLFLIDPALTDGAVTTFRSFSIVLSAEAIAVLSARNA